MSLKVPTIVAEARAALAAGQSVVIGLQSTGEHALDALNFAPGDTVPLVSSVRVMLQQFLLTHFPMYARQHP